MNGSTSAPGVGIVLSLRATLHLHHGARTILYTRASGASGGADLREKAMAAARHIKRVTGDWPGEMYHGVEDGHFINPRPHLALAVEQALRNGCLLVAPTLNRFVRSRESYRVDYFTGRRERFLLPPSEDDFAALRALIEDVATRGTLSGPPVLATILHPTASESEQQSFLTKLTGRAGRPKGRKR